MGSISEERQAARAKFANAPQPFEGTIGAIDCTFVNILGPSEHEEAFVNHHGNHSLNVQAVSNLTCVYITMGHFYSVCNIIMYVLSDS